MLKVLSEKIAPWPNLQFLDARTGDIWEDIWRILGEGGWRRIIPQHHEHNVLLGLLRRELWKPVVNDIIPVYPGMLWKNEDKSLIDPNFIPSSKNADLNFFLSETEFFFSQLSGYKIGVQLSGGMDSSLIIGLLRFFKIPFKMIGMATERHEFRTENFVQHRLAHGNEVAILLDFEQHLPFTDMDQVPVHQYPDLSSINYSFDYAMAQECKRMGIDLLITGFGGDVVFANEVPKKSENCTWRPQIFNDQWLAETVYNPCGVQIISFYSQLPIIDCIYNLRRGYSEDIQKRWARWFFRDFLPEELVNFNYCADFWGLYIDGFTKAVPELIQIHSKAEALSGHPYFSKTNIQKLLLGDLLNCSKEFYQRAEARISLAVWLNSLNK